MLTSINSFELIDLCFTSKKDVEQKLLETYREKQSAQGSLTLQKIDHKISVLEYLLSKIK